MSWHMSPRYDYGIMVSGYPVLTAVNWPYCECPMLKMWTWQDTPETPSLPFDSLPYPTRTIRKRVRSVNHVTTKGKEVDHNLWVWGSVPRALRARGSPAIIQLKINNACAWMKRFFCFCFWKEKDTVRYYMMSLFCLKAIFSKLFRLRAVSLLLENP